MCDHEERRPQIFECLAKPAQLLFLRVFLPKAIWADIIKITNQFTPYPLFNVYLDIKKAWLQRFRD